MTRSLKTFAMLALLASGGCAAPPPPRDIAADKAKLQADATSWFDFYANADGRGMGDLYSDDAVPASNCEAECNHWMRSFLLAATVIVIARSSVTSPASVAVKFSKSPTTLHQIVRPRAKHKRSRKKHTELGQPSASDHA